MVHDIDTHGPTKGNFDDFSYDKGAQWNSCFYFFPNSQGDTCDGVFSEKSWNPYHISKSKEYDN